MKLCENCNKEHDGSYGSGRFCSDHCRRVWVGKVSYQTMKEHGTHKSNWDKATIKNQKPYGTWKCERCNLIFETKSKLFEHNYNVHPVPSGQAWNKGLTKETDDRIAKFAKTLKTRYDNNEIFSHQKGKPPYS